MWGRHRDSFITAVVRIPNVTKVTEVAASHLVHMCVLKADNVVYALGPFEYQPIVLTPIRLPRGSLRAYKRLELTNFLYTDVAFAVLSKPQVMWRAVRLDVQIPMPTDLSKLGCMEAGGTSTNTNESPLLLLWKTKPRKLSEIMFMEANGTSTNTNTNELPGLSLRRTTTLGHIKPAANVRAFEALVDNLSVSVNWIPSGRIVLEGEPLFHNQKTSTWVDPPPAP